jgi:MtN3 and saliva related transmembrane protein
VVYDPPMVDAIGFAAATLTTLSFVPQLVKTWQTRSSGDLSLGMLVAFVCGIVLWIVFGLATHAAPVVAANVATLVLASCQIGLTLRYRQRSGASDGPSAGRAKSESTTI